MNEGCLLGALGKNEPTLTKDAEVCWLLLGAKLWLTKEVCAG